MIGLNCSAFLDTTVRASGNTMDETFFDIVRARQLLARTPSNPPLAAFAVFTYQSQFMLQLLPCLLSPTVHSEYKAAHSVVLQCSLRLNSCMSMRRTYHVMG